MQTKSMEIKPESVGEYSFTGIATTYGNADRDNDIINKGSFINFENSKEVKLPLLYSHNPQDVIGSVTLVEEDDKIIAHAKLIKDFDNSERIYTLIKNEALQFLSIGFNALEFSYREEGNAFSGLNITKAELLEVSVVAIPANANATITEVKSLSPQEIQQYLNIESGALVINNAQFIENYKSDLLNKLL